MAYADKAANMNVRKLQSNLTRTLESCLRTSKRWRRSSGRDHLFAVSSTRDPRKLYGSAWHLVRRATLMRIESAPDRRYDRKFKPLGNGRRKELVHGAQMKGWDAPPAPPPPLVLPYFVPNFAEDEAVSPATKRHSICFFGTATNSLRRRAVLALKHTHGAILELGSRRPFNASEQATDVERQRMVHSRRTLRECKLCLVPAGEHKFCCLSIESSHLPPDGACASTRSCYLSYRVVL